MAHSSSRLRHRPLQAESTSSNPVCATTYRLKSRLRRLETVFCCPYVATRFLSSIRTMLIRFLVLHIMIPYLIFLLLFFWYFGEIFVYNKKNFIQQKAVSLKREKMSEVLLPLVLTALIVGIIVGVLITLSRRRYRQHPTVAFARI